MNFFRSASIRRRYCERRRLTTDKSLPHRQGAFKFHHSSVVEHLFAFKIMLNLAEALPEFAEELSQGLATMGYARLAASVDSVEIAERCLCDEPGCVTFHAVPRVSAPSENACKRIVAPAKGVMCVQYIDWQIIWIEVLGRPEVREKLDKIEMRLTTTKAANQAIIPEPPTSHF